MKRWITLCLSLLLLVTLSACRKVSETYIILAPGIYNFSTITEEFSCVFVPYEGSNFSYNFV